MRASGTEKDLGSVELDPLGRESSLLLLQMEEQLAAVDVVHREEYFVWRVRKGNPNGSDQATPYGA